MEPVFLKHIKEQINKKNIKNSMFFAGVGSRETRIPSNCSFVKETAKNLSYILTKKSFILRSGGATGMDTYFENGVLNNRKEIYYAKSLKEHKYKHEIFEIVKYFHPNFYATNEYSRMLLGRNLFQILGNDLDNIKPIRFAILFTEDGCKSHNERTIKTGGTGQFISYADYFNIPIYNLGNEKDLILINEFIENNKNDKL